MYMQDQKELNKIIRDDLEAYQSILEYGRILLDRDKKIRDKYKWIGLIKNEKIVSVSAVLDLGSFIATWFSPIKVLFLIVGLLTVFLIFILYIRYKYREDISQLISKEDKDKMKEHLKAINNYLFHLDRWVRDLSPYYTRGYDYISDIRTNLYIEKKKIKSIENDLSILYGELNPELECIAQNLANERLSQYSDYIYE